jgi:hypothetical protein
MTESTMIGMRITVSTPLPSLLRALHIISFAGQWNAGRLAISGLIGRVVGRAVLRSHVNAVAATVMHFKTGASHTFAPPCRQFLPRSCSSHALLQSHHDGLFAPVQPAEEGCR